MKLKRILTSVTAQFDDFVSKVENHEAVAETAIRAARQQTAKIHTQLKVTTQRLTDLETRYQSLEKQVDVWKQRALTSSADEGDKDKALRCVQAMKNTQTEAEQVLQQIQQTTTLQAELQQYLQDSEQQVMSLQTRKENLMARSAKNSVKKYADNVAEEADLSSVFERWEHNLAADEYLSSSHHSSEQLLDHEFKKVEQQAELEQTLEALLQQGREQETKHEQH